MPSLGALDTSQPGNSGAPRRSGLASRCATRHTDDMLAGTRWLPLVLVACAAPKPVQRPTPLVPREAHVVVRDVFVSTPERVPAAEVPTELTELAPIRATVELTVEAPFECEASAFLVHELEGSIQGSFGIDRAVTYFIPRLVTERCKASSVRSYVLAVPWMRRSDVPWTIAVAPHATEGVVTRALEGYTAPRAPRSDALVVEPGWAESLTNAPEIERVHARRTGTNVTVTLELEYGNPCSADHDPWPLEATTHRTGDRGFAWLQLVRGSDPYGCGEVYQPTPVTVTYVLPIPDGARTLELAIPNVAKAGALPVYRATL